MRSGTDLARAFVARLRAFALAALASCWAGVALAQDAAEERSQSFRAVEGAVKEDIAGGPLLVAAYAVIWVLVLLYVVRLVRLQQRAERDVARLERVLSAQAPSEREAG